MKYNKQLAKDYEQACANMYRARADVDEYGILCAMHDLMTWTRQRTAAGYSIRETYKKLMPMLIVGAKVVCGTSHQTCVNMMGDVIERVCQSTAISDKSATVNITIFFSMMRYVLFADDYPDDFFNMLNACEEYTEDGLVNMLPIVYDPETGTK